MQKHTINKLIIALSLGLAFIFSNCKRDISDDATPATFPKNGTVYIDGFSPGLEYLPFGDSYFAAFSVDEQTKYAGTSAMRFDVPNVGDPNGAYAGAIFPDYGGRDLSDFDALTFWAKATKKGTINEIGFGQDFRENKYLVTLNDLELTTNWRQYTIAIPDPSKLTREFGLFWYAEGPENGEGYTFWVDELKFEKLGTVAQPRPAIFNGVDGSITTFAGVVTPIPGLTQTFNLGDGSDQTIRVAPAYFEFTSSNPSVATVDENGDITAVNSGEAVITATLGGVDAKGSVKVMVTGNFVPAPTPTQNPNNVISIFSDAYTNVPVDYYNGYWAPYQTTQGQNDININGDNIIAYTALNFVGIQFLDNAPTINASSMTRFHADIQARENIGPGDYLIVRVADVGPDNTFGTGDDSSGEIMLDNSDLVNGQWYSLDVAFSDLAGLAGRSNLAQVVFVSDATISSIYVDNIYFYNDGGSGPTGPTVAAPTPTQNAANVISVFSDAYTNINSNLNPDWGQATQVSQVSVAGNNTLRYGGLNYQGLELENSLDVSGMEFLHIDYWTENSSALNAYLISTGSFEVAKALSVPTSGWESVDIPLGDFSPVDLTGLIQFKFDGNGDIYLDNIYFYKTSGGGDVPTAAAPTPTQNAANVISMFSNAYTNVGVDTWRTDWSMATLEDIQIQGNDTKKYTALDFVGVETTGGNLIDASSMTHFHLDIWTPNMTTFKIKWVDFGANGIYDAGGDDSEHELVYDNPGQGQWVSYDIPLSDFTGLASTMNMAQLIFSGLPTGGGTLYVDNVYFYQQ
ncbi:MAG: Ig-like domain-containing protein [Lewinellaceae bacterium]|nr:Ig-like domain-containing protein [Lewinellaceae bacterium]